MAGNIGAIPVFVAVVEAKSFTGAASMLGLTKSAVSRRISDLEEDLGVRLLHRTTRRLSLTEAGEGYLEHARGALLEASAAEDAATALQRVPRGRLRINTPMSFGRLHVAPAMPAFLQRYPEIQVDMTMDDRVVDLVEGRYDVAIRVGTLPDSSLVARKLAPNHNALCASPAYLKAHGNPATPEELLDHNCLLYAYFSEANEWTFERGGERLSVRVSGSYQVNNSEALREALLQGTGIGRIPTFIVGPDIAKGRLVRLLCDYRMPSQDIYAVWPERRHLPSKVRVFIDFLSERIGGTQPIWDLE
jgi:DNA-binding transcriptional LysR family regulator